MFPRNSVLRELRPWGRQLYVCPAIWDRVHFLEIPPSCPHYPPNLRKTWAHIERQDIRTLVFYHRLSRARDIRFNLGLRKILHLEHRWWGNFNLVLVGCTFMNLRACWRCALLRDAFMSRTTSLNAILAYKLAGVSRKKAAGPEIALSCGFWNSTSSRWDDTCVWVILIWGHIPEASIRFSHLSEIFCQGPTTLRSGLYTRITFNSLLQNAFQSDRINN
jgi:hypothetical protein